MKEAPGGMSMSKLSGGVSEKISGEGVPGKCPKEIVLDLVNTQTHRQITTFRPSGPSAIQ